MINQHLGLLFLLRSLKIQFLVTVRQKLCVSLRTMAQMRSIVVGAVWNSARRWTVMLINWNSFNAASGPDSFRRYRVMNGNYSWTVAVRITFIWKMKQQFHKCDLWNLYRVIQVSLWTCKINKFWKWNMIQTSLCTRPRNHPGHVCAQGLLNHLSRPFTCLSQECIGTSESLCISNWH